MKIRICSSMRFVVFVFPLPPTAVLQSLGLPSGTNCISNGFEFLGTSTPHQLASRTPHRVRDLPKKKFSEIPKLYLKSSQDSEPRIGTEGLPRQSSSRAYVHDQIQVTVNSCLNCFVGH
ncbi:hypothetical protein GGU11DRAFT_793239 [Lentinula aff. detonsa]|nr:hypothetical protein GGU11DRAFT_793239 [Lentinula aff. detonsa]